jgi:hypothetical protein
VGTLSITGHPPRFTAQGGHFIFIATNLDQYIRMAGNALARLQLGIVADNSATNFAALNADD